MTERYLCPECSELATHVAVFDDRFPNQTKMGTPEFKSLEVFFRCDAHIHSRLASASLFYFRSHKDKYLITDEKLVKAKAYLDSGEGVLA